jgi:hypothetical protein
MGARRPGLQRAGFRRFLEAPGGAESAAAGVGPPSLRSSGQWHIWGQGSDVQAFGANTSAGATSAAGNDHLMWCVPMWFPDAVTVTMLAMGVSIGGGGGQGVPTGGEHAWIGLARDSIVGADHWPSATLAGSAVRVIGQGGAQRLAGGVISIACGPNEIVWQVGQAMINGVAGAAVYGMPMVNWPAWGGVDDLRGLAIGDQMPGAITEVSAVGYCSTVGTLLTYTLGRDFPATGRRLRTANDAEALANQLWCANMPIVLYQLTR